MIRTAAPKLRMIAGPNGSGKSTLFRYLRSEFSFPFGYCLNPDEIDRELRLTSRLYLGGWGIELDDARLAKFVRRHGLASRLKGSLPRLDGNSLVVGKGYRPGYFTSIFCDLMRRDWMSKDESFTFETVMSHPDRVDLLKVARQRGYRTYLYYVCADDVQINAARIASRVAQGGHDVPPSTIAERYVRSLAMLPAAILRSTRAYIFDNSGKSHRLIAEYLLGKLVGISDDLPPWFTDVALNRSRIKL